MRFRLAIVGLVVMVPVAALVGWWLMPEPHIGARNFERVQEGMTLAQVEEILGPSEEHRGFFKAGKFTGGKMWFEGGCSIYVGFEMDRVDFKHYREIGFWQRFENWCQNRRLDPLGDLEHE